MLRLSLILSVSIIIFHSCKTLEVKQKEIRLVMVKENNVRFINEEESGCWERMYHYGLDFIKPIELWQEVPLENCGKMVGNSYDDYKELVKAANGARVDHNTCMGKGD